MSNLSPSITDIPAVSLSSSLPRDPPHSHIDSAPMPSPDNGSSASPFKNFSSVISLQKAFNDAHSIPCNTYIKLQDAVNNFKANTCKSAGLPPKSFFTLDNKVIQSSQVQPIRSQSPVTPCLTSRATAQTENRSQSRNQGRSSVTNNTSIRESPSRAANLNSSRTGLNVSRGELPSASKQSPTRASNMSMDNGKYSVIHKRDKGINPTQNVDLGKYRPQTSRPTHQAEEPAVFTSLNPKQRDSENGSRFNVLREILSPNANNNNELVQSFEKEKGLLKKNLLFGKDIVSEIQKRLDTATRCPKHDQPYMLLNTVNKQLFCVDCAFHGPQSSHAKQTLVSLKSASHIITDMSKRLYKEAVKKVDLLEQNIRICRKNKDIAQQEYDYHMIQIDKEFSELMDALRKRKLILKKDLNTVMEDTFGEIDSKMNNLEFLKQSIVETREMYSPQDFDANVEFLATYNVLRDALNNYDYQSFLLSRDHFNVLEIKGKSKIKTEIEAIGKVLPSNYTSRSLQRPKSMPRCSRTSVMNTDKKEILENNYQSRSGAKSAEKYEKTSSVVNSPEKKRNSPSVSPQRVDTAATQPNTVKNSTKYGKSVECKDNEKMNAKTFLLRGEEDNTGKKDGSSSKGSKTILTTWGSSNNSHKQPINPGTPNKENRQKFTKVVDVEYSGESSTGRKRTYGSSQEGPRKLHIPEYMSIEKTKGLFEEIETLKFMNIGKIDEEETIKDVYKEVESVLASIKNKEIFSPKKISFINSEFFKESNILTNHYHAQELYNMLPSDIKHTKLHYRLTRDGPGSKVFHEKCDRQGPCVVLVKVDGSCVFGYYTPVSFTKSDRYDLCEDAFIFSLQNPLYSRPHKFPIKEQKRLFGIFQSTLSPCLGSTLPNKQDLFIQFDDLESSCSVIGYAYSLPPGIEGAKALAGKYTGWRFDEIEVYGLGF